MDAITRFVLLGVAAWMLGCEGAGAGLTGDERAPAVVQPDASAREVDETDAVSSAGRMALPPHDAGMGSGMDAGVPEMPGAGAAAPAIDTAVPGDVPGADDEAMPGDAGVDMTADARVAPADASALGDAGGGRVDAAVAPGDAGGPALDAGITAGSDASATPDAGAGEAQDAGASEGLGPTYLNDADRGPHVVIARDRLSAEWLGLTYSGVRSTRAVAPGEGVFYFEATTPQLLDLFSIGVATAAAPRDRMVGSDDQSFGVDTAGQVTARGSWAGYFPADNRTFGFVVDYRDAHPIVHVIARVNAQPAIVSTETLPEITAPVFVQFAGMRRTVGTHVTFNPGNDTVNAPFAYAPAALLHDAGFADAAEVIVLGWGGTHAGRWNAPPTLSLSSGASVSIGTPVTLTASALDPEDGALEAAIAWEVLSSGYGEERVRGTGAAFTFTPQAIGVHPVRASVTDAGGKRESVTVDIRALGALPQYAEVRMTPDPQSGAGVVISDDGLRVRWTVHAKNGIRANQGLYGAFWYFEAQRLVPPVNQAAGLVIGGVSLDPYPFNVTPPSCSLNTGGGVFQNAIFRTGLANPDAEYYGFAVDYRGRYPIVYVVVDDVVASVLHLTDATVPIYPMLYGNPTGAGAAWDIAINFGAAPFYYDPAAALGAAGVDASALRACWGDANAACAAR